MHLIAGKTLKEAREPPAPYLRDSRAIVIRPITNRLARRNGLRLLSSFLTTFLCGIWTGLDGSEVGRFECFIFLFLAGCLYSLDLDYWTGLLDWTTGLTLELTFELFFAFNDKNCCSLAS